MINDITWRILLIILLLANYNAAIVDVETAFLHGILDEEIYMDCPPGFDFGEGNCVLLQKSIYGLVQAARQYYKKFVGELSKRGYICGKVDPCLVMKKWRTEALFMSIHVDDSLIIGPTHQINETIEVLKDAGFTLKIEGELEDYLSCEIKIDRKNKSATIHQPHLLLKLERKFGKLVMEKGNYDTPGTPHSHVQSSEENKIGEEEHKLY